MLSCGWVHGGIAFVVVQFGNSNSGRQRCNGHGCENNRSFQSLRSQGASPTGCYVAPMSPYRRGLVEPVESAIVDIGDRNLIGIQEGVK